MDKMRIIEVKQSVFADNDADAKASSELKRRKDLPVESDVFTGKWQDINTRTYD